VGCTVADCLLIALLQASLHAQQLSIRHYDVSDGLAHSHVTAIHQDAKGYLWFATWEGLSRFDGYSFINYGPRDGLEGPIINDIAEDGHHHVWVATNAAGVARLIDEPQSPTSRSNERKRFVTFRRSTRPSAHCRMPRPTSRTRLMIFCGHRVEALDAVNDAIRHLQQALARDKASLPSDSQVAESAAIGERHPLIHKAINALEAARTDLQNAAHDFHGHRVEARESVNTALNQLHAAISCDKD
jgi:ligand-binding sensor domain-containing protein